MIQEQRHDGAIMLRAETDEDREWIRKASPKPSKYKHLMNPQGTYGKGKGQSHNRAVTLGRKYHFVAVMATLKSVLHAISPCKIFTGKFKKVWQR
jgi:hypothetical protein